ncbi:GNAT family N-acetyltransferase [Pseudocolwellia agarivorans]|uniref:GNAT family N-acetyltransferase n=1 Tax=Pseudocolwellia agarivorans TaxID=1911682 RepID=UPI00098516C2|nr:GNAT family N-acetyltransferase [Pseudocolwellia agarivorans]
MFEINKATKQDKKDIKRFYKDNNYSASFMGYDHTYIIRRDSIIIGSVIISYITNNSQYGLLHALLITELHRRKGYAQLLIKALQNEHSHIICFADKKLQRLYIDMGFKKNVNSEFPIPNYLLKKFNNYLRNKKDLKIFININSLTNTPLFNFS